MTEVEIRPTYWQVKARSIFFEEYGKERFHKNFTQPTDLYHELCTRLMGGVTSKSHEVDVYRVFYELYAKDALENNHDCLDALIEAYEQCLERKSNCD